MALHPDKTTADWLQPPAEQEGLQRYVETIRERLWLILSILAITLAAAILYLATATKMYDARADLLVTPVSAEDPAFAGLPILRESTDPTRDVETAAALAVDHELADIVRRKLKIDESSTELLKRVSAAPIAQSNIVAITARDESPETAADIADEFANAAVRDRTRKLQRAAESKAAGLEPQAGTSEETDRQLAIVQSLANGPDPTLQVETEADVPEQQATPRPVLTVIGALIAGLALGVGAAFASQVLDPRLRREAQLRRLYRLPILARIPREGRGVEGKPLGPRRISPVTSEAYRTLRATLSPLGPRDQGGRVIMVTGPSPSEGKTTTAVNLAASLAVAGNRVILIEADLRRPSLGKTLDTEPENGGVVSVLIENNTLRDALTSTATYGPNLQLLLADYEGSGIAELFSLPAAERMISDARAQADYVIIDSPPLNEVVDALPLARRADELLIVVRLGQSRLDKIAQLGELLAENDIRPSGFALIGVKRPRRSEYHYYAGFSPAAEDGDGRRKLVGSRRGERE